MSIAPGSKLGPYEILSPLGAGGNSFVPMAVSPDGRTILFTRMVVGTADLVLVENFR